MFKNPNNVVTLVAVLLTTFIPMSLAHITINSQNLKHMQNMAGSMDRTADPCNDFHQYACGNGVEFIDNVGYSTVKYFREILALLQEHYPITGKADQHYTEKLQIYHQTGVSSENAAMLPFLNEVKPLPAQEWPLLEELLAYASQGNNYTLRSWTTEDVDIYGLLGHLFSYGLNNVIIKHYMQKVEGKESLVLSAPVPTPLPTNELIMLLSHMHLPRSILEKYFLEFVETHEQLQTIYSELSKTGRYATVSYAHLKVQDHSFRHMAKFVEAMLPPPATIEELSIVFHVNYFKNLLPKKWQPDEARKLCNYFMLQFLLHLQESVVPGYHLVSSSAKFSLGLNYVYHKHFYLPHKKEYEQGLTATIKGVYKNFAETVAENQLNLTQQQLKEITNKFNQLTTNIGNLPHNVTETMVEEYYAALPDMDPNNYYKNELLVRKHVHLEMLICPSDMICQLLSPHAFYVPARNSIVFPFPALSPPMYDLSWHPVFSVSSLGFATGHELMHTIDSSNLNEKEYTPSFGGDSLQVPEVNAAITCLRQQYPTVNADERLADVIGVQLAFRTYSREYGLQPNFTRTTWHQLFFMSLAQMFCGEGNDIDTEHDQAKVRLQEIVMNSKDFAEAFQCPAGSNMNPVKKCSYI